MGMRSWFLGLALCAATPAAAQTLALETLLGAPPGLAYQGGFRLYAGSIDLAGMLYRGDGVQRLESLTASAFLGVIVDYDSGLATVISLPRAAYAVVPLDSPGLAAHFPVPREDAEPVLSAVLEQGIIRGVEAERRHLAVTLTDGAVFMADVWRTGEGAILVVEGTTSTGGVFSFELQTYTPGAPPAAVFAVPTGLRRAGDLAEIGSPF